MLYREKESTIDIDIGERIGRAESGGLCKDEFCQDELVPEAGLKIILKPVCFHGHQEIGSLPILC